MNNEIQRQHREPLLCCGELHRVILDKHRDVVKLARLIPSKQPRRKLVHFRPMPPALDWVEVERAK
jgi:hypothetical protein